MEPIYEPESWREKAPCATVEGVEFFSTPDNTRAIARAKAVCARCPVADECLAFAIETRQDDGIWGGTTPLERKRLRRMWLKELREAS